MLCDRAPDPGERQNLAELPDGADEVQRRQGLLPRERGNDFFAPVAACPGP